MYGFHDTALSRRALLLGGAALLARPALGAEVDTGAWKDVAHYFDPWAETNLARNAYFCCWASDVVQKVPEFGDLFFSSTRTANEKRHQDQVVRQLLEAGFQDAQFAAVRRRPEDRLT